MGDLIELTGADGFTFSAYLANPSGEPKGRVVVIQEIFGVNSHIREVCDGYAEAGYVALAPALFDRVGPGIELGYEGDDMTRGVEIAMGKLEMPNTGSVKPLTRSTPSPRLPIRRGERIRWPGVGSVPPMMIVLELRLKIARCFPTAAAAVGSIEA